MAVGKTLAQLMWHLRRNTRELGCNVCAPGQDQHIRRSHCADEKIDDPNSKKKNEGIGGWTHIECGHLKATIWLISAQRVTVLSPGTSPGLPTSHASSHSFGGTTCPEGHTRGCTRWLRCLLTLLMSCSSDLAQETSFHSPVPSHTVSHPQEPEAAGPGPHVLKVHHKYTVALQVEPGLSYRELLDLVCKKLELQPEHTELR